MTNKVATPLDKIRPLNPPSGWVTLPTHYACTSASPPASQPGGDTNDGPIPFIDGLTPQDSPPSTTPQDNPSTPDEQCQNSPIIERHRPRRKQFG
ncbi:uncharacterized protein CPUR_06856 [Claviceps purpurea 20.1]|uniref:Uncharacterized protein n=1 Tax=Claviceps purpurea (strain 20.1) TaxID=1111077 RepID=M1WEF4_CLAP2|nr:uncharacterized protein CPUR_06856 [Claviceps purpurea 20.1]